MQIIVSDSSCLIDLKKAFVLDVFLRLPFEVIIPDLMFAEELLSFTQDELQRLVTLGLQSRELSGESVLRAVSINRQLPALTLNDCFAFVLASETKDSILLTGDSRLRTFAETEKVRVHGLLWAFEQMRALDEANLKALYSGLQLLHDDPSSMAA